MTKPLVTEKDIRAMRDLVERTRATYSPEDHATLEEMVEFLAEVRARAIEHDGDDDDPRVGEQLLIDALAAVRARLRKPT